MSGANCRPACNRERVSNGGAVGVGCCRVRPSPPPPLGRKEKSPPSVPPFPHPLSRRVRGRARSRTLCRPGRWAAALAAPTGTEGCGCRRKEPRQVSSAPLVPSLPVPGPASPAGGERRGVGQEGGRPAVEEVVSACPGDHFPQRGAPATAAAAPKIWGLRAPPPPGGSHGVLPGTTGRPPVVCGGRPGYGCQKG